MDKQFKAIDDKKFKSITGILPDKCIYRYCKQFNLIAGFNINNIESASYDLTVDKFLSWELNSNGDDTNITTYHSVVLKPNQLVFIRSKEIINMPNNMIGRVVMRNRFIRAGLVATAPLFQPGDKGSNVFVCIRNLSNYDITLKQGESIVQIYFEVLSVPPDIPYDRDEDSFFKQSTSFNIPTDLVQRNIKESEIIDKKINNFEARIYTMVATFVGAFVSILALIIVNFSNDAFKDMSISEIIKVNISLSVCIAVILKIVMRFSCSITKEKPVKKKGSTKEKTDKKERLKKTNDKNNGKKKTKTIK